MEPVPFVDDHTRIVAAPPAATWRAARDFLDVPLRGIAGRYGRLVGLRGDRAFTLDRAEAPYLLGFSGAHRFSTYRLTITLRELGPSRTELTAHTSAVFPGIAGRLYRLLVIDSRAHVLATRFLLRRIARRAEVSRRA